MVTIMTVGFDFKRGSTTVTGGVAVGCVATTTFYKVNGTNHVNTSHNVYYVLCMHIYAWTIPLGTEVLAVWKYTFPGIP